MSHIICLWRFTTEHKYMLLAIYQIVIFLRNIIPQKVKTLCPTYQWPCPQVQWCDHSFDTSCCVKNMGRIVIYPPVIHCLVIPYFIVGWIANKVLRYHSFHDILLNSISILYIFFTFRLDGALFSRETEWLWLTVTTLLFSCRVTSAKLNTVAVTYYLNLNLF